MRWLDLIRDWIAHAGPEHWDPDQDPDVRQFRAQKAAAEAATDRLRQGRPDLVQALRRARAQVSQEQPRA